jgi:hypothetical protein
MFRSIEELLPETPEEVISNGKRKSAPTPTLEAQPVVTRLAKRRAAVAPHHFRSHPFFFTANQPCLPLPDSVTSNCYRCAKPPTTYCCRCCCSVVCNECAPIDYVHRMMYAVGCCHCSATAPQYAPMAQHTSMAAVPNEIAKDAARKELVRLLTTMPESTAYLVAGRVELILRLLQDETKKQNP